MSGKPVTLRLGLGLETSIIYLFYLWSSVLARLTTIVTDQCLYTDSNSIVQLYYTPGHGHRYCTIEEEGVFSNNIFFSYRPLFFSVLSGYGHFDEIYRPLAWAGINSVFLYWSLFYPVLPVHGPFSRVWIAGVLWSALSFFLSCRRSTYHSTHTAPMSPFMLLAGFQSYIWCNDHNP